MSIPSVLVVAVTVAVVGAAMGERPARAGECGPSTYLDYARLPPFDRRGGIALGRDGIPVVRHAKNRRAVHNPVTVAQYGLQQLSYFACTGGAVHRANAERAGRWLVGTQDRRTGKWLYGFDWSPLGTRLTLEAPWSSAMAQGQAMSLLIRLYLATGDATYVDAARRARRPLTSPVAQGGLVASLRGNAWYEEYPTRPPTFVLNGFMFTLLGLHDLAAVDPSRLTHRLYERGIRTLRLSLPLFDVRGRSLYHLAHRTGGGRSATIAPAHYQRVHVKLLGALDARSPHRVLRHYRDRWRAHVTP